MKILFKALLLILLPLLSFSCCDKKNICIYNNKDIVVFNNTGFNIDVAVVDNFNNVLQYIGSLDPFEREEFSVPHSVFLAGGTTEFSERLFIDPCQHDLELSIDN